MTTLRINASSSSCTSEPHSSGFIERPLRPLDRLLFDRCEAPERTLAVSVLAFALFIGFKVRALELLELAGVGSRRSCCRDSGFKLLLGLDRGFELELDALVDPTCICGCS